MRIILLSFLVLALSCSKTDKQAYPGKIVLFYEYNAGGCPSIITGKLHNRNEEINSKLRKFVRFIDTVEIGVRLNMTMHIENCAPDGDQYIRVYLEKSSSSRGRPIIEADKTEVYGDKMFVIDEVLTEDSL